MIHLFKQNGFNICLDVNSGAIHVPDDTAYGILEKCNSIEDYENLKNIDRYNLEKPDHKETYAEIGELIEQGSLFSKMEIPALARPSKVQRGITAPERLVASPGYNWVEPGGY